MKINNVNLVFCFTSKILLWALPNSGTIMAVRLAPELPYPHCNPKLLMFGNPYIYYTTSYILLIYLKLIICLL
jgi:hypothetical protein